MAGRKQSERPVAAEAWLQLGGRDVRAGTLTTRTEDGREGAAFTYDRAYLEHPDAYALDPRLPLGPAQIETAGDRKIFGAFTDCSCDLWGCRLVELAQQIDGGAELFHPFNQLDYVLNVLDPLREGALRFRLPGASEWSRPTARIPGPAELPALLRAAHDVDGGEPGEQSIRLLVGPGSSIGGARPKAAIVGTHGDGLIAKFPRVSTDRWDAMAWEALTLRLSARAGIRTAHGTLVRIDGQNVLVLTRFDRNRADRIAPGRIGYASAMTLLAGVDGERRDYLELAETIIRASPDPAGELAELWRRLAFTMLVSNTDDHLRNHGFLRATGGWVLSPAFDVNPTPGTGPKHLATALDGSRDLDPEALLALAPAFRLEHRRAKEILAEVREGLRGWEREARELGIDDAEIELMTSAFVRA